MSRISTMVEFPTNGRMQSYRFDLHIVPSIGHTVRIDGAYYVVTKVVHNLVHDSVTICVEAESAFVRKM